jgi:hypothetical protein
VKGYEAIGTEGGPQPRRVACCPQPEADPRKVDRGLRSAAKQLNNWL